MPDTEAKDVLSVQQFEAGLANLNCLIQAGPLRYELSESYRSLKKQLTSALEERNEFMDRAAGLTIELASALEAQQKAERERNSARVAGAAALEATWKERDKARADIQRLKEERDDAMDDLREEKELSAAWLRRSTEAHADLKRMSMENAELRKDREREYFLRFPKSIDYCGPYRSIDEMREDSAWEHSEWTPVWRYKAIAPGSYHEIDREAAMNPPAQETTAELPKEEK